MASAVVVALVTGLLAALAFDQTSEGGEILLEGNSSVGANPFVPLTPAHPGEIGESAASAGGVPQPPSTDEAAMCDPETLISYLDSHPSEASAWARALNADPTLRWSGGTQVQVNQIGAYVRELTPRLLAEDERVTNHQFRAGDPTAVQAVLQKGTAVLSDKQGVARVRCKCGNPLTPKRPVSTKPTYTGAGWPGFQPPIVVVIDRGKDRPSCDEDEYFDGQRCQPIPDCDRRQYFDGWRCAPIPRCDPYQYYDGEGCVYPRIPIRQPDPGTQPGTGPPCDLRFVEKAGQCVPDDVCLGSPPDKCGVTSPAGREAAGEAEAERVAQERAAREEAAREAEAERVAQEEAAREEAAREAEAERVAQEEAARKEAAREAEAERVAQERAARKEAAREAEAERVAQERAARKADTQEPARQAEAKRDAQEKPARRTATRQTPALQRERPSAGPDPMPGASLSGKSQR